MYIIHGSIAIYEFESKSHLSVTISGFNRWTHYLYEFQYRDRLDLGENHRLPLLRQPTYTHRGQKLVIICVSSMYWKRLNKKSWKPSTFIYPLQIYMPEFFIHINDKNISSFDIKFYLILLLAENVIEYNKYCFS